MMDGGAEHPLHLNDIYRLVRGVSTDIELIGLEDTTLRDMLCDDAEGGTFVTDEVSEDSEQAFMSTKHNKQTTNKNKGI
eukprot:5252880-Heterocapsa_arctica.AAC.1